MRLSRPLLIALLLVLAPAGAGATPIEITSGFLDVNRSQPIAQLHLFGGEGFSFVGGWDWFGGGNFRLFTDLHSGVDQSSGAVGSEFQGSATIRGLVFPNANSSINTPVNQPWAMLNIMRVTSDFVVPTIADPLSQLVILTAFTFTGTFSHHDTADPTTGFRTDDLVGSGIATITLAPGCQACAVGGVDVWQWVDARYDFMEPVPEPGTLVLLASGLVGLSIRRRRAGR
jgi:hypothetical protein